jgi:hypothetical protein
MPSAANLKFLFHLPHTCLGTSNLKAAPEINKLLVHPLIPTFAKGCAAMGCELRNRCTGLPIAALMFVLGIVMTRQRRIERQDGSHAAAARTMLDDDIGIAGMNRFM